MSLRARLTLVSVAVLAVTIAAVVTMIVGPIAELVPSIEGAALWVFLVAIGMVLLALATSLERGRAKLSATLRWMDERLDDWE